MKKLLSIVLFLSAFPVFSQMVPAGFPVLEEALRRKELLGELQMGTAMMHRPLQLPWSESFIFPDSWTPFYLGQPFSVDLEDSISKNNYFRVLPLRNFFRFSPERPYGQAPGMLRPAVGAQNLLSGGVEFRWKMLHAFVQPEWYAAENRAFDGFPLGFPARVNSLRQSLWNRGDMPEVFSQGPSSAFHWGNSKLALQWGLLNGRSAPSSFGGVLDSLMP